MFHDVPRVPRGKMERFACVDTQTYASPQRSWRRVWGEEVIAALLDYLICIYWTTMIVQN
ncbi:hypothetical protein SAMN05216524_106521 [Mucilaginibacter sp. OK098]|nr:hypothetical protein SAMN05216524_106521 [Mucilaginibacter sp. OK098]